MKVMSLAHEVDSTIMKCHDDAEYRNRLISPLYGEGPPRTRNRKSSVEEREGTAKD